MLQNKKNMKKSFEKYKNLKKKEKKKKNLSLFNFLIKIKKIYFFFLFFLLKIQSTSQKSFKQLLQETHFAFFLSPFFHFLTRSGSQSKALESAIYSILLLFKTYSASS